MSEEKTKRPIGPILVRVFLLVLVGVLGGVAVFMWLNPEEARRAIDASPVRRVAEAAEALPSPAAIVDPHGGRGIYIDAIDARNEEVRALAIRLTRRCRSQDRGCEASRLLRHIAANIKYVSDPRGGTDHIQTPTQTLALEAGDCEDQTILLASLFEAVGIRTLLAFTKDHVYAMACTPEPIHRRYLGRGAVSYVIDDGALHCYPAEPTSTKSKLGQEVQHDGFAHVVDPIDRRIHQFEQAPRD